MLHPEHLAAMADARRADDLRAAHHRHAHPPPPTRRPLARVTAGLGRALVRLGEAVLRSTPVETDRRERPLAVGSPRRA